jgi:hypothetical protein
MSVKHPMSSDYRPRGGSSPGGSSSSSGGGGRRRRGGRNRGSRPHGEHRSPGNHTNGTSSTPAKKENPIAKLFGWLTGKKKSSESRPGAVRPDSPRAEYRERDREPREPRADRPRREDRPPKPEPTPQEITTPKLYVGNLSYDAVESDLFDLFSKVGHVKNVEVAMDRHANRSKGFGFVEMESLETAKEAAEKLNRTDFMGRQIVVSGAKLDKRSASPSREADASPDAGSV